MNENSVQLMQTIQATVEAVKADAARQRVKREQQERETVRTSTAADLPIKEIAAGFLAMAVAASKGSAKA